MSSNSLKTLVLLDRIELSTSPLPKLIFYANGLFLLSSFVRYAT